MNALLLETYLILWLHRCGLCWCELAGDFLDLAQQGHLKAWRYSMKKKKKKTGEGHTWMLRDERGMGVWLEDTSLLWRKLPMRDPSGLEESHELLGRPHVRQGQLGTSQLRLLLLYCLSSPSLPQIWRSQKPNRKARGLTIIHPYHH